MKLVETEKHQNKSLAFKSLRSNSFRFDIHVTLVDQIKYQRYTEIVISYTYTHLALSNQKKLCQIKRN